MMADGDEVRYGPDEDDEAAPPPRPWSAPAQIAAAILWPSFLAACLATMLFFAFVDPELMGHETTLQISRMTGYGIGFFFFWFVTAISSAVSVYLLRTGHLPQGDDAGRDPRP
jgi:hypothetical protein